MMCDFNYVFFINSLSFISFPRVWLIMVYAILSRTLFYNFSWFCFSLIYVYATMCGLNWLSNVSLVDFILFEFFKFDFRIICLILVYGLFEVSLYFWVKSMLFDFTLCCFISSYVVWLGVRSWVHFCCVSLFVLLFSIYCMLLSSVFQFMLFEFMLFQFSARSFYVVWVHSMSFEFIICRLSWVEAAEFRICCLIEHTLTDYIMCCFALFCFV